MGHEPKYGPGGDPSHRRQDGRRVNALDGYASPEERARLGPHRARRQSGRNYIPPDIANPGNVVVETYTAQEVAALLGHAGDVARCTVGGGNMGNPLCHENEAPFPERLAEFYIRSFCRPGGIVLDCCCGSGTTLAVALAHGRRAIGCDIRADQVELTRRRIASVQWAEALGGNSD
jgi:hypothetical protein